MHCYVPTLQTVRERVSFVYAVEMEFIIVIISCVSMCVCECRDTATETRIQAQAHLTAADSIQCLWDFVQSFQFAFHVGICPTTRCV